MQLNKLNEVSKAAALKASASLSKLIEQPVGVYIAPAMVLGSDEFPSLTKPEDCVVSITAKLSGDLRGLSLMLFPKETALILCDMLLRRKESETENFDALEVSALTEIANILFGNFLTPFAHPLKIETLMHHVPNFKCETFEITNNLINQELSKNVQDNLLVEIMISLNYLKVKGFLIFMLSEEGIKSVLER